MLGVIVPINSAARWVNKMPRHSVRYVQNASDFVPFAVRRVSGKQFVFGKRVISRNRFAILAAVRRRYVW
jgi:hypothetical protein